MYSKEQLTLESFKKSGLVDLTVQDNSPKGNSFIFDNYLVEKHGKYHLYHNVPAALVKNLQDPSIQLVYVTFKNRLCKLEKYYPHVPIKCSHGCWIHIQRKYIIDIWITVSCYIINHILPK